MATGPTGPSSILDLPRKQPCCRHPSSHAPTLRTADLETVGIIPSSLFHNHLVPANLDDGKLLRRCLVGGRRKRRIPRHVVALPAPCQEMQSGVGASLTWIRGAGAQVGLAPCLHAASSSRHCPSNHKGTPPSQLGLLQSPTRRHTYLPLGPIFQGTESARHWQARHGSSALRCCASARQAVAESPSPAETAVDSGIWASGLETGMWMTARSTF